MKTPKNKPSPLVGLSCVLLGALYASAIGGLLHAPPHTAPLPEAPVRVHFSLRSSSAAAAAAASAPLKLETPRVAPKPRARAGQSLVPHSKASMLPSSPPTPTPTVTAVAEAPTAVSVPGPEAPPAHVDELGTRVYPEQPGGPTLVLALLVNGAGEVLSVKVMVPSAYPLQDVNYPLLLIGRKFNPPQPPLPPGQTRWIDLRIHYTSGTAELP